MGDSLIQCMQYLNEGKMLPFSVMSYASNPLKVLSMHPLCATFLSYVKRSVSDSYSLLNSHSSAYHTSVNTESQVLIIKHTCIVNLMTFYPDKYMYSHIKYLMKKAPLQMFIMRLRLQ